MKTLVDGDVTDLGHEASAIVRLSDARPLADGDDGGADALRRARIFAEPLLNGQRLDTGEDAMAHAEGVARVLAHIGAAPSMQAAAYLVYAGDFLQRPQELVAKAFGDSSWGTISIMLSSIAISMSSRRRTAPWRASPMLNTCAIVDGSLSVI
jgi:GTP pyrophosphokinase